MSPQAAKTELRPGSLISGKYRLQRQLGRGASGAVWSAVNVATSRKVALKVLLRPEPKARERLLREAKAAGALKHPNVVDVYDVIVADDGSPALVLEFLEGQTLEQLIAERAPLPELEVAAIARDVARALGVAHASGIVHRDLKPANIFLHRATEEDAPIVKVVDFGISKNTLSREETLTETGMAVGSPSFMSPEQVRGERDLDGRTDLWALGVIMYEMLSAKRLFDGRAHEVLTHVLSQPIVPLRDRVPAIDPELEGVVAALLERDLGKRLASADDVAFQLSAFLTARGRSQSPTDSPPTSRSQPRDTSVLEVPKASALPVIHTDDEEEEEATHVAPMAMRQALAQRTVPTVYEDDEEEEDRTRVAPDALLTAAIRASKDPSPDSVRSQSDQNTIPTVRPPGLARDNDPPAESTLSDGPPVTEGGTQVMPTQRPGPASSKPASNKAPPAKTPAPPVTAHKAPARSPVMGPAIGRVPVAGGAKSPVMGPAIAQVPVRGKAPPPRIAVPKAPDPAPAPPPEEPPPTPRAPPISERAGAFLPPSERAPKPVSERTPAVAPVSERAAPSSRRAPPAPHADDPSAPKVVIDKSVSERPAAEAPPAAAHADVHSSHPAAHGVVHTDAAHAPRPSAVETAVHRLPRPPSERSDAVRTWVLTLVVAALVIFAAYLYTHRG